MSAGIEIHGLKELIARLDPKVIGPAIRRLLTRAAISGTNFAKVRSPVDTGRLRASIASEIDPSYLPLWATIGSNVTYAAFQELGTRSIKPVGYLSGGLADMEPSLDGFVAQAETEIQQALGGGG
jgi:hypothetical protein